ncbi:ImmA/IrrE family metallo-endopeptidase [Corynebacterium sp. TA-R-1]|uniref:ImmA/IrrE family metallo-endopeptidase n=1 Tax=Corynebacterium stercoris TaxID=2943490 RepID=A0ABT1G513_9CORY|nr:ImmA/IrrE family metallo-endopeptidase [Corynebacterium stercoris]MCP1388153.1 ImmA/IrrE family metallo-endopeptidase [Corynebacterium stercoris]
MTDEELNKRFPKIQDWIDGEAQPTLRQARELADRARLPFGRLLLLEPSGEEVGIADFRTVDNTILERFSPDLREIILKSQQRLAWYSEYAIEEGIDPPALFNSAREGVHIADVAATVRESFGFEHENPLPGPDRVLTLTRAMENSGILVSRNSVVEHSNKRKLDTNEFRGFTIEDDGFCLVFVNATDSKSAQLFSLAHELGHVVFGAPGLSDHSDHLKVERRCNRFASEFIAPEIAVRSQHDPEQSLVQIVEILAPRFGMSREAMLWRLVELDLRDRDEATEILPSLQLGRGEQVRRAEGGPSFHVLVRSRVGGRFFDTVTRAAQTGKISEAEAARYLGVKTYESYTKMVRANEVNREAV